MCNSPTGEHSFQCFGNYQEECFFCGAPNGRVVQWKRDQVRAMEEEVPFMVPHPYVVMGIWTSVDYKRYMASPWNKRKITR